MYNSTFLAGTTHTERSKISWPWTKVHELTVQEERQMSKLTQHKHEKCQNLSMDKVLSQCMEQSLKLHLEAG